MAGNMKNPTPMPKRARQNRKGREMPRVVRWTIRPATAPARSNKLKSPQSSPMISSISVCHSFGLAERLPDQLLEPIHHPASGEVDGSDADPQPLRHLRAGPALDRGLPERLPGRLLEG